MQKEMSYIESLQFSAQMNVCSGFKQMVNALIIEEPVNKLYELVENDWSGQFRLAHRILELIKESGEEEYEHPHDVPLTAYLYVLNKSNQALALTCSLLVNEAPRCFWAWRMAKELQNNWNTLYGNTDTLQSNHHHTC